MQLFLTFRSYMLASQPKLSSCMINNHTKINQHTDHHHTVIQHCSSPSPHKVYLPLWLHHKQPSCPLLDMQLAYWKPRSTVLAPLSPHALKLKNIIQTLSLLHLFSANSYGFYMLENISQRVRDVKDLMMVIKPVVLVLVLLPVASLSPETVSLVYLTFNFLQVTEINVRARK